MSRLRFRRRALVMTISVFFGSSLMAANGTKRIGTKANRANSVYETEFESDFRLGSHIQPSKDLSTARTGISLMEKINLSKSFKISLGGRYENEALYNWLPQNYPQNLRDTESNLAWVTDTYLKVKLSSFVTTLGYQQVVWGETFGNNISDIVNPKDFRELTLENLSRTRLQVPIVNLQWLNLHSSFQAIYIPFPQFNWMPKIGSDFAFLPATLNGLQMSLDDRDPGSFSRGEWGGRISKQFTNLDMALFYLDYFDRQPVYEFVLGPAVNSAHLIPHHRPLKSYGANVTYDLNSFLIRAESVYNSNRSLNTISQISIAEEQYNELNLIGGIDLPSILKCTLSFQYSEELLQSLKENSFASNQKRLDIGLTRSFGQESGLDAVVSLYTMDGSGLFQIKYHFPLMRSWELEPRVDLFGGSAQSVFGRYVPASRALVTLKGSWL